MQVCVSHSIRRSTGSLRFPILPEDVKPLLEQIKKLCGKISVAKVNLFSSSDIRLTLIMRSALPAQKETSRLAELCEILSNRLSDHSLVLRGSDYDDIKRSAHPPPFPSIYSPLIRNYSNLVHATEQLTSWSKFNYPKSLCKLGLSSPLPYLTDLQVKRGHIEAGVAGCTEKLEAVSILRILVRVPVMGSRRSGWIPKISQAFQPIPTASSGNQEAHPPGRRSVERTSSGGRASEDIPGSLTETGDNAGTFATPGKNVGDDPSCPLFSSMSYRRVIPRNTRSAIFCRLVPVNRYLSNDWMGRSQG